MLTGIILAASLAVSQWYIFDATDHSCITTEAAAAAFGIPDMHTPGDYNAMVEDDSDYGGMHIISNKDGTTLMVFVTKGKHTVVFFPDLEDCNLYKTLYLNKLEPKT